MTTTVTAFELQFIPGRESTAYKSGGNSVFMHSSPLSVKVRNNDDKDNTSSHQIKLPSHIPKYDLPHTPTKSSQPSSDPLSLVPTLSYSANTSDVTTDLLELTQSASDAADVLQPPTSCSSRSFDSDDTLIPLDTSHGWDDDAADPSRNSYHSEADRDAFELDPWLNRIMSGRDPDSAEQPRTWSIHTDELEDSSDSEEVDDFIALEDAFACLQLKKPCSASDKPSPETVLKLTDDFQTQVSSFRSSSEELVEALRLQMGDAPSKLDERVLLAIRRAASNALEAAIMVSWFRETKLDQAVASSDSTSAANKSFDSIKDSRRNGFDSTAHSRCTSGEGSPQSHRLSGIDAKPRFESGWNAGTSPVFNVSSTSSSPRDTSDALSLKSFLREEAPDQPTPSNVHIVAQPSANKSVPSLRKIKTSLRSATTPKKEHACPVGPHVCHTGRCVPLRRAQASREKGVAFDPIATLRETRMQASDRSTSGVQPAKRGASLRALLRNVSS